MEDFFHVLPIFASKSLSKNKIFSLISNFDLSGTRMPPAASFLQKARQKPLNKGFVKIIFSP